MVKTLVSRSIPIVHHVRRFLHCTRGVNPGGYWHWGARVRGSAQHCAFFTSGEGRTLLVKWSFKHEGEAQQDGCLHEKGGIPVVNSSSHLKFLGHSSLVNLVSFPLLPFLLYISCCNPGKFFLYFPLKVELPVHMVTHVWSYAVFHMCHRGGKLVEQGWENWV